MGIYILKRKTFTKYDETDNLKRMKDSDILAERKKQPETTGSHVAAAGLAGGLVGGAIGSIGKAVAKSSKGNRLTMARRGGKWGAVLGAGIGLATMASKRSQEKAENSWYNDRLEYAQRQARRREKKDWKANMTERDGYSY
jgi:hypothetical protein